MSVITTRTSVLSILKIGDNKPSPHHVRFRLPTNIRQIFLNQKSKVKSQEYQNLVVTLRDSDISDDDLLKLLEEATKCVGLLDYELRLFVQALVILGWTHRSERVIQVYHDFLLNVISAHPQHSKDVIVNLVKLFSTCEVTQWNDDETPNEIDMVVYNHVHKLLKNIVQTIPLTADLLIELLKSNFPYHTTSPIKQKAFIYNVLKILDYLPSHRKVILSLIVDRLLNLDVHAPRDDILEKSQEQFEMDDIKPMDEVVNTATALDSGMILIFRYIDSICKNNGTLRWMETKALFADLLDILDKCILSTYGSHHVQFILFYFVSFKPILAQNFLEWLWKKVAERSVSEIVRRLAAAHIASFLTRANFIPSIFLKNHLERMCEWLNSYVERQEFDSERSREMSAHSVFYAVCQAVFYVVGYRHDDLADSKKKLVWLQSLNLMKLVSCPLNPLRFCDPNVVNKFAAVTKELQIAYCYTIIEQNSKGFLKTTLPEPYFPYDRYVLKRSQSYITPLYRLHVDPMDEITFDVDDAMDVDTEELIDEFLVDDETEKNFHPVSL